MAAGRLFREKCVLCGAVGGNMGVVSVGPDSPQLPGVVHRLADEFAEAAASADYAGETELARSLADRAEVMRWADSSTIRSSAAADV